MKNVNALEIARLAGVSRATVSRVINNYEFVKPQTREKVMQVIEEYGYAPHYPAQILAGKRTRTIGLFMVVSDDACPISRLEDTHFNFMMQRIIQTAALKGYFVLVFQVSNVYEPLAQKKIRDMFTQQRIDAGLFVGFPNVYPLVDELVANHYVAGVFDQYKSEYSQPNRIIVRMDYSGIAQVVDYAVTLGHRNILMVSSDMHLRSGIDTDAFFKKAMRRNHLAADDRSIARGEAFTRQAGAAALEEFLTKATRLPSFILCGNDAMAFGVMDVLQQKGLRIPQDVSVSGSDDILVSRYVSPALTTLHYDFDDMMTTLTMQVIKYVEKPSKQQFVKAYSPQLIFRDTCAKFEG